MPGSGIPLDALVVIDNCVLAMLTEFAYSLQSPRVPHEQCVAAIQQWISNLLDTMRSYTPDGRVHCTDAVAREYKPENGALGRRYGIRRQHIDPLAQLVPSLLDQVAVNPDDILALRQLPGAPRKYVRDVGCLSNNDISLILLGLSLTGPGSRVYVISNDQYLAEFVTFVRDRSADAKRQWPAIKQLYAFHSMTYLERIHRACSITTEQLAQMLRYVMTDHINRMAEGYDRVVQQAGRPVLNPNKARDIFGKLLEVQQALVESAQEKERTRLAGVMP